MRWAYVCADPGVPVFGQKGCSVHVQEVVRALLARDIDVEIFATRAGGAAPDDLSDVPFHALPCPPSGDLAYRERACLDANHALRQALQHNGPFDCVFERYSLWSFAGMDYAQSHGSAGLLEVNAPLIDEQARHRGLSDRARAESVARGVFSSASIIIAVSMEVAGYLRTFPPSAPIAVLPNGVNVKRFTYAQPARSFPGLTIGFVGTLKPWHGVDVLIESFARVQAEVTEAHLVIVGDGPERAALMADVQSRNLAAHVHFTGAVDPAAVPAWLAAMDIAVASYPALPNFYFSPLKLFEYMAAGRAIVASRIGQINEVIDDGVTGLLFHPGDTEDLTKRLLQLAANADVRQRMGAAARAAVCRDHTWAAVAQRLLDLAQRPRCESSHSRLVSV